MDPIIHGPLPETAQIYQCRFCMMPQLFYIFQDDRGHKSTGFVCSRCHKANTVVGRVKPPDHPDECRCELCEAERIIRTPLRTCTKCGKLILIGQPQGFDRNGGPYCRRCEG